MPRGDGVEPDDCTAPAVGRRYRVWITNPAAITSGDERVALARHPATCPPCLARTLAVLGRPVEEVGADGRDGG